MTKSVASDRGHWTNFFKFYFNNFIVPMGFLPWGIRAVFPREGQLRQSHATQPAVHAGCFHNPPNSYMDYRIFNMCIDVNACDYTRGCMDTVRESMLKVDSGRKIPCRTRELNLHWQCAGLMLYHLSYISIPTNNWKSPQEMTLISRKEKKKTPSGSNEV